MPERFPTSVPYEIYDETVCACGEGPLWHPQRQQLYWVDVTHHKILTRENGKTIEITFDEFVTALGWIDKNNLIAATETALVVLNLSDFSKKILCALEADNPSTRSNDGRADPWGGFWISTMGKDAENNAGKIYRYFEGNLSVIIPEISIPNAICFDRNRSCSYFADTKSQKLYRLNLDPVNGDPIGSPSLFKDFSKTNESIDGAIVDTSGTLWLGVWDGKNLLKINPEGKVTERVPTGADRPTCPSFGGENHSDVFVTTAAIGLENTLAKNSAQGKTLVFRNITKGEVSPRFKLPASFQF